MYHCSEIFEPLWKAENGFTVSNKGDHKVLFIFDNEADVDHILSTEPWSFDKSLVVLQKFDRSTPLSDLPLDKTSFWVQVHNIPIGFRSKSVAKDICGLIGIVDRSTTVAECECRSYVQVRVTLDVFQPLCRGKIIKLEDGEKVWVNFRYEHLPNICYWCGCFDHGDRDCDFWIQSKGTLKPEQQQFGSWIRASQLGATKKSVVRVSGFYEDRQENISTRRRREGWKFPAPVPQSEKEAPNKENSNQSNATVIPEKYKVQESTPYIQDHEIEGDSLSQQLKEIDRELGFNEDPLTDAGMDSLPNMEASPLFDLEKLKNSLEANPSLPPHSPNPQSHNTRNTPLHDLTNSHSPIQEIRNSHTPLHDLTKSHPLNHESRSHHTLLSDITNSHNPSHNNTIPHTPTYNISNSSTLHVVSESPLQAKWKRLQRAPEVLFDTWVDRAGSKRPLCLVVDHRESPNKKIQVSCDNKENTPMLAEAGCQPHQA